MEDVKAVYGNGPLYVTGIKDELPLFIPPGSTGIPALAPMTLPEMFQGNVTKYGDKNAMNWRVTDGAAADGKPSFYNNLAAKAAGSHWEGLTWKELADECYTFGAACLAAGMQPKDAIVVMGFNTPQWLLAFYGGVMAGGVTAGSYPTNGKDTCEYLTKDCGGKIALVESWSHGVKFVDLVTSSSEKLSVIVVWGSLEPVPADLKEKKLVVSFADFMASGAALADGVAKVKAEEAKLKPTECCTLIYTSGTTGPPKGVMLSHDNMTWDANAGLETIKTYDKMEMGPETVILSYLPLSHVAAQVLDVMLCCASGGGIFFATPDALSGGLLPLLQQTRPTFFFGVPRVWEKMMDAMKAKSANNSPAKIKIAIAAKELCLKRNMGLAESGGRATAGGCFDAIKYAVFNKLVYSKVRETLGLDRAFLLGSGAAPISKDVLEFFWSLDLPVIEGFGMSETTGIMTISSFPTKIKLGCVGAEIGPGCVKLDYEKDGGQTKGEHGEICLRGRNIMMGYLNKPEKTAETFDSERYLRSGDLGKFFPSPGGKGIQLLAITGRLKELLITAGGENIPPVLIEDSVKANCPMVSNAVLIGDRKKFLTVLLTLRVVMNTSTLEPTEKLDANGLVAMGKIGSSATTVPEAKADEVVLKAIQKGIDACNAAATSRAQKIQKFTILDGDLSVPGGELTATQKLKRSEVTKKYAAQIDAMYGGSD